ncbi:MAG: hypothetical protein OEZ02_10840, partial [Anaerolineae bacterium]|nr:hypothetical protein [Anaerolineae bacterium]
MRSPSGRLYWGLILILVGAYSLAVNLGVVQQLPENIWGFLFALLSLTAFGAYMSSKLRSWTWLFPALIFAALSAITWLAKSAVEGSWLGGLFMLSIAIPFWVAFLSDRTANWWATIPAWALS